MNTAAAIAASGAGAEVVPVGTEELGLDGGTKPDAGTTTQTATDRTNFAGMKNPEAACTSMKCLAGILVLAEHLFDRAATAAAPGSGTEG
ncbi:hypothetical protein BOTBODRAFT_35594 [Botryobasidium botryosum FD-172 SS1]|uniref:Uncharacterized protein n=1 Tax=Botryobasidium botryosum (strain FD-172 SS1) TaxID=930990 RepID=A0A067MHL2_BOTB1|nr:hypothetical protein BOTBODRAFT_35594 [Botryobasidium botryosum FD-172 SS1]